MLAIYHGYSSPSSSGSSLLYLIPIIVIILLIFWGIVFAFIMRFVRKWKIGNMYRYINETALDILEKRYARGEIDKDEFEEKKRNLGKN